MRFIRYKDDDDSHQMGWVLDDLYGKVLGDMFGEFQREEARFPLKEINLLPPVIPGKIICVGRNYAAHAKEHNADVPEVPLLFLKPPSSIIGPGDPIRLPPQSKRVEHEAELTVVIGKEGRWISPDEADDHIFGYTVANDVTARDLQRADSQWTRGKGFDTFCPIGPWIETDYDPSDSMITCHVNGDVRQMASTRDMVFSVKQLIAFASSFMTLSPGDIILTGTPAGVSPLLAGDFVEVGVEGIGKFGNPVKVEPPR